MSDSLTEIVESTLAETPLPVDTSNNLELVGSAPSETTEQPKADAPIEGLIGIKAEQPSTEEVPTTGKWKLEAAPDLVIAISDDGKPITAAEVQAGYMRLSDYTKKTTEIADFRKDADVAVPFYKANLPLIQALSSGQPELARAAVLQIAKDAGVDLGQSQPQRNERGQFTKADQEDELYDLETFEEGTDEYAMAAKWNAHVEKNRARDSDFNQMKSQFDQLMGTINQVQTQGQAQEEAEAIASEWRKGGLEAIDVDSAVGMVGQPMTVEQAMTVSHFQAILAHNARILGGLKPKPDEPGGSPPVRKVTDTQGMSLEDLVNQTVR